MERKRNIRFALFRRLFPVWLCCVLPLNLWAQEAFYPTENRLFHIERSKNRNLVCYDAHLTEGKLDSKKPLDVYWIDREEAPGKRKGLTAIQRRMAYGYKLVASGEDSAQITLTAYSGRVLRIRKLNGKYVCVIQINNRPAILHSLYVQAKPKDSLSVEYVELRGKDMETGELLTEQVTP
ncbi:DUF4833 domain-containing protein [Parabacteroides sp. OttesenSCG-928-J18]|nr:DUF4833 domain-containing protein [Parabacteroides sp. OttesenSCG-928-J18]